MYREGKKCVLYLRVSTEMQVDGFSLDGQRNRLERFANLEEMPIVDVYQDAGKSGKSIDGRPEFKRLLSDIKGGLEIDYILVYKLSRFGRNASDILNSLELIQSYGINLICVEEGIDSSQASGKLLISVLSAVTEIERENILEQTMNGRREKARQGGWNGGFAPYGYYLENNHLYIQDEEAEVIKIIYDMYGNSNIGYGGIAKYLNLQGIKKVVRQNGTLEMWSGHTVKLILDNPVYCGKIAYGRRTKEKVKGSKNEYKMVYAEDFILEKGKHEAIIDEELWNKVYKKRKATGVKQPSKVGKDRSHLLTGILKCPKCGGQMYTNKHAWTMKDGTYKEVYYYMCGRNKLERGHHCDYKANLRKTDIEPYVIETIKRIVTNDFFVKEIKEKIGIQIDVEKIDIEIANYQKKLNEILQNKNRLENEIDNLPIDAKHRERKLEDMTKRLDSLYDLMVEIEERIDDAKLRKNAIEMKTISLENIYAIMQKFTELYDIISDEEKKAIVQYLIKEIQIYPKSESSTPLKSIEFNFPIYYNGEVTNTLLLESGKHDESIVLYECKLKDENVIELIDLSEKLNISIMVYLKDVILVDNIPSCIDYLNNLNCLKIVDGKKAYLRQVKDVYKIIFIGSKDDLIAAKQKIPTHFFDKYNFTTSSENYLEITSKHINKGNALINLTTILNIDLYNTIAVGDEENDLSMIKAAHLGCCVENANPVVKEQAKYITLSNEEDGVKEIIKKFVLSK